MRGPQPLYAFGLAVLAVLTAQRLQILIGMLGLHGVFFDFIAALNFGVLGYLIVAMFLLAWGLSVAWWKFGRIEQRFAFRGEAHPHTHAHAHDDGVEHSHDHVHQNVKLRP